MPPTKGDAVTFITIDNFTPGIITNSDFANVALSATAVPGNAPGQAQNAVGCIALPSGGLAPLPSLAGAISPTHAPSTGDNFTNGLFSIGQFYITNVTPTGDELIWGQANLDGSTWTFYLEAVDIDQNYVKHNALTLETLGPTGDAGGFSALMFNTITGGQTIAGDGTDPNIACWAFSYWFNGIGTNMTISGQPWQWLWPDPTNPTGSTPYVLQDESTGYVALLLTHQSRIVLIDFSGQVWGPNGFLVVSDVFNYTDPPESLTLGNQGEVFVAEHPVGTGAWGTISSSELFCVKNAGGGYLVSGDLNTPTITYLAGVTPTYGLCSRTASTPIGIVYASNNRGVWVWNGANTSQKISNQLEDNFMIPDLPVTVFEGPTVDLCAWGDWILTTNDWLYDTNLGGWWKLPPSSTGQEHLWFQLSYDQNRLFAAPPTPSSSVVVEIYDRTKPAATFTWQSYPIRPPQMSEERQMTIQEVVVRAQGDGTVTITLTGVGGSSSAGATSPSDTITFDSTGQPIMKELRTGIPAQDVIVEIVSTGASGKPAPVVYSVAIGYVAQNLVSAT